MKHCKAIFISDESSDYSTAWEIAAVDKLEKNKVDFLLWSNSKYEPNVLFSIAHTKNSILLKYEVSEQYTTARYSEINDPVFRDSCVEFFIGFDDDDYYYNLEFNCLGTPLVGYGSGDKGRKIIDKDLVGKINSYTSIKNSTNSTGSVIHWELVVIIPFAVFAHHAISTLSNKLCKANFYKCGDDLPEPHFLSWNNIDYPTPNFHLPQFFGEVYFLS